MARVLLLNFYEVNYLGTRLLASWLRSNGHETHNIFFKDIKWEERAMPEETHLGYQYFQAGRILCSGYDIRPYSLREAELLEQAVRDFVPDVLGCSARSANDALMADLCPRLRRAAPEALLVAGGHGPSLRAEWYLQQGFDVVVRGDGEETLLELADHHDKRALAWAIANTSWRHDEEFIHNPLRRQNKNIDTYPAPLHGDAYCSFIDNDTLHPHCDPMGAPNTTFFSGKTYSTFLGRGCARRCTYCCGGQWAALYRREGSGTVYKCRLRGMDSVLDELVAVEKSRFSYVEFVDECFSLSTTKAEYFFTQYAERVGLPFSIYLDYQKMLNNRNLFQHVVDAGLDHTDIGIQTGSEEFARRYYRRTGTNNVYRDYAWLLFHSLISTRLHFIGGNCYEDEDTFSQTLDFIKQMPFCPTDPLRNTLVNVRLKVFPHTPITTLAPRVQSAPMPSGEWWRRGILMELRRIVDDAEMNDVRTDACFLHNPALLHAYYWRRLEETQRRIFTELAHTLAGKPVVFFGVGAQWRDNKAFFHELGLRPQAFLVSRNYVDSLPTRVDGVPLHAAEDFFSETREVDVIIFSESATGISRRLRRGFGLPAERMHPCANRTQLSLVSGGPA